jgi:hypothetical protein
VSRFHVLRSRTRFGRYCVHRVPFSCFALPDSFSAVPRTSGPVLMFCAPRLIFYGTEGAESRFHVLLSRTHFWRYRGRLVPFSSFALPDLFSTVLRATSPVFIFVLSDSLRAILTTLGPIFLFCAPGLVLGGTEGTVSRFNVLRSRTHFGRC